jgi:hypothetical protein
MSARRRFSGQGSDERVEQARDAGHAARSRAARAPVGWLLGPDLLAKLSKMLRRRSDPRDWMPYYRGAVHDECWSRDGSLVNISGQPAGLEAGAAGNTDSPKQAQSAERVADVGSPAARAGEDDDAWFDYVSDMGDASDAMYSIAYASMIAFDAGAPADTDATTWLEGREPATLTAAPGAPPAAALPRGQFLFIGGDTAYHVADAVTLHNRVAVPFGWAFEDARANGHLPPLASAQSRTRRIYGIPGNHDWYDNLQGFSLVFRLGAASQNRSATGLEPIELPEFERVQLASYAAIQLPHGWQLWGLDIDTPIDPRQQAYFESLGPQPPERLIVATPSPALAFGAAVPHPSHTAATQALGIPLPPVPLAAGSKTTPAYRLDVSGDVHHYARYYPRKGHEHYGSVVSGLGGAFHHPTFGRATGSAQRVEPVRLYPTSEESKRSVGARLLRFKSTWYGSWARLFPLLLTVVLSFAATRSLGGQWLLDQLLALVPGVNVRPSPAGARQLAHSLGALAACALAMAGVVLTIHVARRVYDAQLENPHLARHLGDIVFGGGRLSQVFEPRRSYWLAWGTLLVFAGPFVLYPLWGWRSETPALDTATAVIVVALPLSGAVAGLTVGAANLKRTGKTAVAAVGFVHAAAQVVTAVLCARLVAASGWSLLGAGLAFAIAAGGLYLGRPLFQGATKVHTALLAGLWAVVLVLSFTSIVYFSHGRVLRTGSALTDTLRAVLGGLVAMPLGTTWLVWYFALAGALGAHNNEVGGAARVTQFREFIRFHVHARGVTGYVIAVESRDGKKALRHRGRNLVFRLIDVFTVATPLRGEENSAETSATGASEA